MRDLFIQHLELAGLAIAGNRIVGRAVGGVDLAFCRQQFTADGGDQLTIYSDNTDSEKIRKALENVFGQKDTAVIMGKVATKKANLVIRAKEITRKLNHNEY